MLPKGRSHSIRLSRGISKPLRAIPILRSRWLASPSLPYESPLVRGNVHSIGARGSWKNGRACASPGARPGEAHVAHGLFHYYGYRQYEEALAEFQRALQLQPNNAQALEYSVIFIAVRGNGYAVWNAQESLEQDPRNPMSPETLLRLTVSAQVARRRARRQICTEHRSGGCDRYARAAAGDSERER